MNAEAEMRAALQARFPECYDTCPDCDGEGFVLVGSGPTAWDLDCALCVGTGRVSKATLAQLSGEMGGMDE